MARIPQEVVGQDNCLLGADMDMKRRAARGVAVLAVALAAGHLVQSIGKARAPQAVASAEFVKKPTKVEPVAAGPEAAAAVAPVTKAVATQAIVIADAGPALAREPMPASAAPPGAPPAAALAKTCDVSLDLMVEPNAMIGLTLLAPCHPNQRVVLHQGGLAVTGKTTATGALFTDLPAMETPALVEVAFADGTRSRAEIAVPDLATLRRFGLQWQPEDTFQIHAFENGATYGDPGHISAAHPYLPAVQGGEGGGFLTLLGEPTTDNPLLAEVYTFPKSPTVKAEVVVEAAVTDKSCARELIAETLNSAGGRVFVTDLTVAMPECAAKGDYLVLKNLVLDLNMASAN